MKNEKPDMTDRDREKVKLVIYLIFFLIIVLMLFASGPNNKSKNYTDNKETKEETSIEDTNKKETYLEKQGLLINSDYSYKYVITGNVNFTYIGEVKDLINVGYRESDNEIIKYKSTSDKTVKIQGKEEIEYNDLYIGLDSNLLDFNNLFDMLNSSNTIINREEELTYYNYENVNNYNIKVYVSDKYIEKIEIKSQDLNYELTFEY